MRDKIYIIDIGTKTYQIQSKWGDFDFIMFNSFNNYESNNTYFCKSDQSYISIDNYGCLLSGKWSFNGSWVELSKEITKVCFACHQGLFDGQCLNCQ